MEIDLMVCISDQMLPIPLDSGFKMDGYWVWCGSVVEDPDGNGFHMFASRWPGEYPMLEGYIYLSEIVRAWSPTMQGPYKFAEKVLPTGVASDWNGKMAHNPTIVKYGEKYLLYYIASTYDIPLPAPDVVAADTITMQDVYHRIRIGVLIANHPAGPWKSTGKPILESRPGKWDRDIVTNPAPCVLHDGRIFLYYRSNTPDGLRIGLAVADTPEGPYKRFQDEPVMQGIDIEDPFVWHNGSHFEMIAKDMTGKITGEFHSGAHFSSDDGITWQIAREPKAYSKTVFFNNNTSMVLGCLERPQLLFGKDGNPKCMFAAAADGPGGFSNAQNTWNIAIPLAQI
jgi:hypothetical protein